MPLKKQPPSTKESTSCWQNCTSGEFTNVIWIIFLKPFLPDLTQHTAIPERDQNKTECFKIRINWVVNSQKYLVQSEAVPLQREQLQRGQIKQPDEKVQDAKQTSPEDTAFCSCFIHSRRRLFGGAHSPTGKDRCSMTGARD